MSQPRDKVEDLCQSPRLFQLCKRHEQKCPEMLQADKQRSNSSQAIKMDETVFQKV